MHMGRPVIVGVDNDTQTLVFVNFDHSIQKPNRLGYSLTNFCKATMPRNPVHEESCQLPFILYEHSYQPEIAQHSGSHAFQ